MGLFSTVLHLRDVKREHVVSAMDALFQSTGMAHEYRGAIPAAGPRPMPESAGANGLRYAVSERNSHWLTMIQTSFDVADAPDIYSISKHLSAELSCYALTLVVHDGDLFFYTLDQKGRTLDGYNSCPQYFEAERLSEADIRERRHSPESFGALLPTGRTLEELRKLLNSGWWHAHDAGRLDENGVPLDDDGFVLEEERMTDFGTLLELNGHGRAYPYAAWAESSDIDWSAFIALHYRLAGVDAS